MIVDEARRIQGATVVFFYCKHGEETRNSFVSVVRSILAQILAQNPHLLPYFYEKASISSDATLGSSTVAKEMIKTALNSCEKTYVIIDGLDECARDERKAIAASFRAIVEGLPPIEKGSVRCLFVSQDDGIARDDFRNLPNINIKDENRGDLGEFADVWHQRIEGKFGKLESKNHQISKIITARAQGKQKRNLAMSTFYQTFLIAIGMFIFAELFAKYLEDQFTREDLLIELDPVKLPVNLDHV